MRGRTDPGVRTTAKGEKNYVSCSHCFKIAKIDKIAICSFNIYYFAVVLTTKLEAWYLFKFWLEEKLHIKHTSETFLQNFYVLNDEKFVLPENQIKNKSKLAHNLWLCNKLKDFKFC